jgi:hypothetical protein
MSGRLKAGIAITAVAVAVPVASVLGRGAGQTAGPGQVGAKTGGVETARVHPVSAPSGAGPAAGQAKSGSSTLKLAYFETKKKGVERGQSGIVVGPVPRRCLVLNGYYFIFQKLRTTDVLSMGDSPAGTHRTALREWAFYRDNESGARVHGVRYGVVCLKGAGLITGG